MREKNLNQSEQLTFFKKNNTVPKATKLYINNSSLVSPIYTFSLARKIIVYTPHQGTNREKYFNHNNYKEKMATLAGSKHLSVHFSSMDRVISIFRRKKYGSNPSEMDISHMGWNTIWNIWVDFKPLMFKNTYFTI